MEDSEDSKVSAEATPPWSIARVAGYSILVAAAFFAVQFAVIVTLLVVQLVTDPELDVEQWFARVASDGLVLALATISTTLVCFPFVKYLVGRREADPWTFLRLKQTDVRPILAWTLALVAFVVFADTLNVAIGRPVVSEFMSEAYLSAHPALLFVALVFAAPIFEEIFFRGFVLGALESSGVPAVSAAIVSSLAWAAIHMQYDLYDLGIIFLMGLLFAAARTQTGSLIPCLAMHSLANAIAFFEAVFATRSAGV